MLNNRDDLVQDFLLNLTRSLKQGHNKYLEKLARKLYARPGAILRLSDLKDLACRIPESSQVPAHKAQLFGCWADAWKKQGRKKMTMIQAAHELSEEDLTILETQMNGEVPNLS